MEPKRSGKFKQGYTDDIFHDQIRKACLSAAAVQQARYVGMLKIGQELHLILETRAGGFRLCTPLEYLNCHLHTEIFLAHAAIHGSHAALADQACNRVMANALAD